MSGYTVNRTAQGMWEVLAPSGINVCWCQSHHHARMICGLIAHLSPEEWGEACKEAEKKKAEDYRKAAA